MVEKWTQDIDYVYDVGINGDQDRTGHQFSALRVTVHTGTRHERWWIVPEMRELMEKLKREAIEGGELKDLPCPLCGRTRSQRSDYIRCTPCATNWLDGEDLSKDPRIERHRKMFPMTAIVSSTSGANAIVSSVE